MSSLRSFFLWPVRKLTYAALLAALGLAGVALWLFNREGGADFENSHRAVVRKTENEISVLKAAQADADRRMATARTEIAARRLRANQAAKVAQELEDLNGGLSRLTGDAAQLKENDERMARMREMEADSKKKAEDLEQSLIRIQWEKDGIEISLEKSQAQLAEVTAEGSLWEHYLRRAWEGYGIVVLVGVVVLMLLPPMWRLWRFSRS